MEAGTAPQVWFLFKVSPSDLPLHHLVICLGSISALSQIILHSAVDVKLIFCLHRCCIETPPKLAE